MVSVGVSFQVVFVLVVVVVSFVCIWFQGTRGFRQIGVSLLIFLRCLIPRSRMVVTSRSSFLARLTVRTTDECESGLPFIMILAVLSF